MVLDCTYKKGFKSEFHADVRFIMRENNVCMQKAREAEGLKARRGGFEPPAFGSLSVSTAYCSTNLATTERIHAE